MTMVSGLSSKLSRDVSVVTEDIREIKEMVDPEHTALTKRLNHMESASNDVLYTMEKLKNLSETVPTGADLVDLRKAVKAAISVIKPIMKEFLETRRQVINLKTYLRTVPPVQGDSIEIQGLMASLILNAVEAMPRGGDLYVTTEENAGFAHIYVQDSGVGIPDAIKDRLMDPFFTTKGKERLGLGLSLSYAIVKRHKGEMEFTSGKGQGTAFTVRLPIVRVDQTSKSRVVKKKVKNAHILIIESEEILNKILLQVFLSKRYRVVAAESVQEGLQILKKKRFDLILLDAGTVEMQRDVVIKKIREMNEDQPMVLIIDQGDKEPSQPEKQSEFELIVTKPLDMNRVMSDIEDILREHAGRH
jgi:CheY-like chemotaxis protein